MTTSIPITKKKLEALHKLREMVVFLGDDFKYHYDWLGERNFIWGWGVITIIDNAIESKIYTLREREILNTVRSWYYSKNKIDNKLNK